MKTDPADPNCIEALISLWTFLGKEAPAKVSPSWTPKLEQLIR
jgi:hypothetical protein